MLGKQKFFQISVYDVHADDWQLIAAIANPLGAMHKYMLLQSLGFRVRMIRDYVECGCQALERIGAATMDEYDND